ncbi:MAG: amidase family protein [Oscillospiraceae bacterium]
MNLYLNKNENASANAVVLDDLFLTKDMPTTGGSAMLEGYMSLFDAEVISRLKAAGYSVAGKANIGEFSIDMLGETSKFGACVKDNGTLTNACAEILDGGDVKAALCFDVNGTPRRAAALCGKVYIKPTYGTVSRYGTIAVACSGETVGVMANNAADCAQVLSAIAGHDDKDGTSLSEEECSRLKSGAEFAKIKKIAVAKSLCSSADEATKARLEHFRSIMSAQGIELCEIEDDTLLLAKTAWNVCMSAELCNNVSRFDGVKYGYRAKKYNTIEELYTNSRTEAFGDLLKTVILFGSDSLSTENYMRVYDKSLRIRRVVAEFFADVFKGFDAVLMPACSKTAYTTADTSADKYLSFDEALYTAPASLTGLPAAAFGGVQLVGRAFSDLALLDAAAAFEKEDK